MQNSGLMKAIETPVRECFSSDEMEGSWYHEHHASNTSPHSFHRYDKDGCYVMHSTVTLAKMPGHRCFYHSDRFGNKLEKEAA